MIAEIFLALLKVGVPVAGASYLLVWWALKHQYIGQADDLKALEAGFKRLSSAKKSNRKKNKKNRKNRKNRNSENGEFEEVHKMNVIHNKWLSFGGGFYGVVGLLTYAVIELLEIRDFLSNFRGIMTFFSDFTIDLVIGFFVNSIMNFVAAIAWPVYWMNEIHSQYIWVWFVAAYAGYWCGTRYALRQASQNAV